MFCKRCYVLIIYLDEIIIINYSNFIDFTGLIFEITIEGTININKHNTNVPIFNNIKYTKSI